MVSEKESTTECINGDYPEEPLVQNDPEDMDFMIEKLTRLRKEKNPNILMNETYSILLNAKCETELDFAGIIEWTANVRRHGYSASLQHLRQILTRRPNLYDLLLKLAVRMFVKERFELLAVYSDMLFNRNLTEAIGMVYRTSKDDDKSLEAEYWAMLRHCRLDCKRECVGYLLDAIQDGAKVPKKFYRVVEDATGLEEFANFPQQQYDQMADLLLRACRSELLPSIPFRDEDHFRSSSLEPTRDFIVSTYFPLFAVCRKLGLTLVNANPSQPDRLIVDLAEAVDPKWSPVQVRLVAYILMLIKIRVPDIIKYEILLPHTSCLSPSWNIEQAAPGLTKHDNVLGLAPFRALARILKEHPPEEREWKFAMKFAGMKNAYHLFVLAYYYNGDYQVLKEKLSKWENAGLNTTFARVYAAVCDYRLGNYADVMLNLKILCDSQQFPSSCQQTYSKMISGRFYFRCHLAQLVHNLFLSTWTKAWSVLTPARLPKENVAGVLKMFILSSQLNYTHDGYKLASYALQKINKLELPVTIFDVEFLDAVKHASVAERLIQAGERLFWKERTEMKRKTMTPAMDESAKDIEGSERIDSTIHSDRTTKKKKTNRKRKGFKKIRPRCVELCVLRRKLRHVAADVAAPDPQSFSRISRYMLDNWSQISQIPEKGENLTNPSVKIVNRIV